MERITSQHEAITTTLCLVNKTKPCLSTEEKEVVSTSPFLQATEDISGDKYVSISMIIPLTKLLIRSCSLGPECELQRNLLQGFSDLH